MNTLPRALAAIVGDALGSYYYSHNKIETLLYDCGASGEPPEGNCQEKITRWLLREAETDVSKAFSILGKALDEFMDTEITCNLSEEAKKEKVERLTRGLKRFGLEYRPGGRIFGVGVSQPSASLEEILRSRNLPEISQEFERAIGSVEPDPPAAVTAACAILESLCKVYLEDEGVPLPSNQTLLPLWSATTKHIGLSPSCVEGDDLKKILSGLTSVVDGIAAFRTHVSSAHGRGRRRYAIAPRHARFVVHAAHSLATFFIETWEDRKQRLGRGESEAS